MKIKIKSPVHQLIKSPVKLLVMMIIMVIGSYHSISAQEINAGAKLDTTNLLIGQQVDLKLRLAIPAGKAVIWPAFGDTLGNGVEIVHASKVDTLFSPDKKLLTLSQRLRITSFDTGIHIIPSIPFYAKGKGNDSLGLLAATEQLMLQVNTIAVDTTKAIKDVKMPMSLPITFEEIYPWILIGIGLLALAWVVFWYLRKRRQAMPLFGLLAKPELPPHIIALEEFERLRNLKLWQSGRIKEYHTALTDILRTYLEHRYGIMALEMVSDEILDTMKGHSLDADITNKLREVLLMADLVKFAKARPLPDEHDNSLKFAIDVVNETALISTEEPVAPVEMLNQTDTGLPGSDKL